MKLQQAGVPPRALGWARRAWSNRAVLIGSSLALGVLIGLGLRFPATDTGPETPPLADLETGLSDQDSAVAEADAPKRRFTPVVAPAHRPLLGDGDSAGAAAVARETVPPDVNRLVEVKRGDTLMKLLLDAGIERREAHDAVVALSEVFSPRRLRPGQEIRLALWSNDDAPEAEGDGGDEALPRLAGLSLNASVEEEVHVRRQGDDGGFVAESQTVALESRLAAHAGTIDSSLFMAARDAGMPNEAMIQLIRLFSFDVDFQREVQPGDQFEVIYESYYDRDGELAKTGPLRYGAMMLSGKRLEFYHFVAADGTDDHFDANGRSVRRALLRTPIDGARISSGYGMRKHPIQGYNKMHRGVDFAASRGTPIYAAGNGTIDRFGRNGGYGKYIRIRHNSTYRTAYAHMKGYAKGMKRGARVKQGQVIGFVGSTGNSTGPHLHYEVFVDGKQVNPRKIKLPSGKKLKGADLEDFQEARAEIDRLRQDALPNLLLVEADCEGGLPLALANGEATAETPSAADC